MSILRLAACAALLLSATAAATAAPTVVASIKPVHSLVASVMRGVGEPVLLVKGGDSPHTYAMRPSDATALSKAGVVFLVGEGLETFLADPLETLAPDATVVSLIGIDGLTTHAYREGGAMDGHAEAAGDEHGHDDAHAGEDGIDPHIWLDPDNAAMILDEMAEILARADPQNAEIYRGNARAAREDLARLDAEIARRLAPVSDVPFVAFHDAYQYFQRHYGLNMVGTITVSPDRAPGAARIREIQREIGETGAACVFAEPQFDARIVDVVTEGTPARRATVDPVGAALRDGPELYPALLSGMAQSFAECLSGKS